MKQLLTLSLGLFSALAFSLQTFAAENIESLDKIVAVVNDFPITQSEVNGAMSTVEKQYAATNTPIPAKNILQKQILQQLIDKRIQLQLADQAGLTVSDTDVTKAIQHIADQNNASLDDLYNQVKNQGLTVEEYRKEIHDQIVIQQVQQHEVASRISITPQEVKEFMHSKPWQVSNNKEYHIEDIVISLPDTPTSQQLQEGKKKADNLFKKLQSGNNFQSTATTESSGDQAMHGGDLGWRKLPEIPSAFAEKILHMQENEITGPIQTPNGFHIIHLAGIRGTAAGEPDTSTKQIEDQIYQRKMEEGIQSWLSKMRSQAFINLHPEN